MMQYSLVDRRPEETCLALLKKNNIGVLARGTVAGGLLAGKTATPYLGFSEAEIMTVSKAVQAVTPPNSNAATTAIRFVLQQPAITSAVVGVRTEPQLKEVLQAIGNSEISAPALNALNESIRCLFYDQHR
jgi:aryl-alcohol dehydrogenase-like predicted oxidoreductase